jgi:hypothetical protein
VVGGGGGGGGARGGPPPPTRRYSAVCRGQEEVHVVVVPSIETVLGRGMLEVLTC